MLSNPTLQSNTDFDVSLLEMLDIDIRPQDQLTPVIVAPAHSPAAVYIASLAEGSRRTMIGALDLSARVLTRGVCDAATLPWWALRKIHTNALRGWLISHRQPATANKTLSAVRGTLRAAWDMELLSAEDYHRAASVKSVKFKQSEQAAGRAITHGEVSALLRACAADPTPAGPRDAVVIGCLIFAGLRRAEVAGLQLTDYHDGSAESHRSAKFWVTSKNNTRRDVPVAPGLDTALDDWLALRGRWAGPLITQIRRGGHIQQIGITPAAVYNILNTRAAQAGIATLAPHDGRRTFAGELLDNGADIVTVQKLMGHSDPKTTASYDRRNDRARTRAVNTLHMPWTKSK